jgi:peptidoglycan LD-endopeptidase CwlK
MEWSECPPPATGPLHSRFGGIEWRYDQSGVFIAADVQPQRTMGEPTTCRDICDRFRDIIIANSVRFAVPPEIIVMTIATEAAAFRSTGYTGQPTFRWEAHVTVADSPPKYLGDYSIGPMQTLATTAREVIGKKQLAMDAFANFPALRVQPPVPPADIPGYDPVINIEVGTAEFKARWSSTEGDPILVSAAYNAGSLRKTSKNRWRLVTHGNHLDRASKWYGDACAVISGLRATS